MNINKVGVVGAGMMGAEIALCFARSGFDVVLCDINEEAAKKGKDRQASLLDKSIQKGKLDTVGKDAILSKVKTSGTLSDLAEVDLVVEAVLEVLEVKNSIFKDIDQLCKADCIICSNTSSISITKLAASVTRERQHKFIGTHFNSPASVMKLVEVIPGQLTDDDVIEAVVNSMYKIEKEPVKVKDVTGFGLNRLFHVFTAEACRLLDEGVASAEDIDKICVYGLGHPVGIFKLLDLLGHDLNLKVDEIMFAAYGERFRPSPSMQRLVDAGLLGKKSGQGFHKYE